MTKCGLKGALAGPNVRWRRQNGTEQPWYGTVEPLRGALA